MRSGSGITDIKGSYWNQSTYLAAFFGADAIRGRFRFRKRASKRASLLVTCWKLIGSLKFLTGKNPDDLIMKHNDRLVGISKLILVRYKLYLIAI